MTTIHPFAALLGSRGFIALRYAHYCFLLSLMALSIACHAGPDDAAGQAKELSDPVRRENAIANLTRIYAKALDKNHGDRSAAEVKAVADAAVEPLSTTYIAMDDVRMGLHILELLDSMRDPRALSALLKALEWRAEVNEEHAIRSARTIASVSWSPADRAKVIGGLIKSLQKVQGKRAVDNRLRIETLRALGKVGDKSAASALVEVMTSRKPEQDFLINRLAAEQLGRLADASVVPALIKALFIFKQDDPGMRMNDVATEALVRIGKPALQPLLKVLRGEDDTSNAMAEAYIKAVARRDERAAKQMSTHAVVATEASFALGQLGFKEAYDALVAESHVSDTARKWAATMALVALSGVVSDKSSIRSSLVDLYKSSKKLERPALLLGMQNTYDPELLSFFLDQAKQKEEELPDIRFLAAQGYALLANKGEAGDLKPVLTRVPGDDEPDFRKSFAQYLPMLDAATACDQKVACWIDRLTSKDAAKDPGLVRKSAAMLVRLAAGQPAAVTALVKALQEGNPKARADVLFALDQVAKNGSKEAVSAIDAMAQKEEGSASWQQVKSVAMVVQARLSHRSGQ